MVTPANASWSGRRTIAPAGSTDPTRAKHVVLATRAPVVGAGAPNFRLRNTLHVGPRRDKDQERQPSPSEFEDWVTSAEDRVPPWIDPEGSGTAGISSVSGLSPGAIGVSPLIFSPDTSTPWDANEPEEAIPSTALWAMKDRMHSHQRLDVAEPGSVNCRLGDGDSAIYMIDDGRDHCMISRLVGHSPDGCVYCLAARISIYRYVQLRDGEVELAEAFSDAHDICLCGVFEDELASNVILVEHYKRADSIPDEYLPPAPFLDFSDTHMDE